MRKPHIKVDVKDKKSLETAIKLFQKELSMSLESDNLQDKIIGFVDHDGNMLTKDDYHDVKVIEEMQKYNIQLVSLENTSLPSDYYIKYSHGVVFENAVNHPELISSIVCLLKQLVEFSIKQNNPLSLFFSQEYPSEFITKQNNQEYILGDNIFAMLFEKYPEYLYMYGDFIASYDDDYFTQEIVSAFYTDIIKYFWDKHDLSDHMLNLLVSCRYTNLEGAIYSNAYWVPNIEEFIYDNNKQALCKKYFIESFRRYPQKIEFAYPSNSEEDEMEITNHSNSEEDEMEITKGYYLDRLKIDSFQAPFSTQAFTKISLLKMYLSPKEQSDLEKEIYNIIKNIPIKNLYYENTSTSNETLEDLAQAKKEEWIQQDKKVQEFWNNPNTYYLQFKEIILYDLADGDIDEEIISEQATLLRDYVWGKNDVTLELIDKKVISYYKGKFYFATIDHIGVFAFLKNKIIYDRFVELVKFVNNPYDLRSLIYRLPSYYTNDEKQVLVDKLASHYNQEFIVIRLPSVLNLYDRIESIKNVSQLFKNEKLLLKKSPLKFMFIDDDGVIAREHWVLEVSFSKQTEEIYISMINNILTFIRKNGASIGDDKVCSYYGDKYYEDLLSCSISSLLDENFKDEYIDLLIECINTYNKPSRFGFLIKDLVSNLDGYDETQDSINKLKKTWEKVNKD